jgi:hypothetical protein
MLQIRTEIVVPAPKVRMAQQYAIFGDITIYGSLRTDVSEERIASIIRVTKSASYEH